MSIFTTAISFKTENIHCYYLCKQNEMIIICKDCCDLLQKVFSLVNGGFFNETQKCLIIYYLKKL